MIPLKQEVYSQVTNFPRRHLTLGQTLTTLLRKLPGLGKLGMYKKETWMVNEKTVRYSDSSNITTLGGFQKDLRLEFKLEEQGPQHAKKPGIAYMNTAALNVFKVAFGFALTVATFLYTQSWWFLAWFGPFIWFGITGFRNILQATLGGGGLRRTPLLGWNAYLSWSRLCDSLMFTGLSVPLLELGVRALFLEKICGIDSLSNPLFYSVISIVNGVYIAGPQYLSRFTARGCYRKHFP